MLYFLAPSASEAKERALLRARSLFLSYRGQLEDLTHGSSGERA